MIDTDIVRSLLRQDTYEGCREKLRRTLFAEEVREVYDVLSAAHEKYGHDLTPKEVFAIWKAENPVATKAERNDMRDLIEDIEDAEELSGDVVIEVIDQLWRRDLGKQVATLGLEVSEGNDEAMAKLTSLLAKHADGFVPDDFGEETTQDLDELLADMDDSSRFRFNIETLHRQVPGIGRTELGILFATVNAGKTAMVTGLTFGPGGYIDQGLRVMILGNEEATKRTVVRAYYAATGMTKHEVIADPQKAKAIYRGKTDGRVRFKDIQGWDLAKVNAYIAQWKPDVVFIDQLDKVKVSGGFEKSHEKLREIYLQTREMAKSNDCAIWGVSQASNDANGRTRVTMDMMEGSKVGKAAEADLILGIGKHSLRDEEEDDPTRYLTISKNKINGWHGTILCNIQPEISRYAA